jgi:hypothetical protein
MHPKVDLVEQKVCRETMSESAAAVRQVMTLLLDVRRAVCEIAGDQTRIPVQRLSQARSRLFWDAVHAPEQERIRCEKLIESMLLVFELGIKRAVDLASSVAGVRWDNSEPRVCEASI